MNAPRLHADALDAGTASALGELLLLMTAITGPMSGRLHQLHIDTLSDALAPWVRVTRQHGRHTAHVRSDCPLSGPGAVLREAVTVLVRLSSYGAAVTPAGKVTRIPPDMVGRPTLPNAHPQETR